MYAAAEETIGFKRKKNQDWFDENDEMITSVIEVSAMHALVLKITLLQRTNGTISRQMQHARGGFVRPKILGGSRNQKTYKSMPTSRICAIFLLQQSRSLDPLGHQWAA